MYRRADLHVGLVAWGFSICLSGAFLCDLTVAAVEDGDEETIYGLKVTGGARHFQVFQRSSEDHSTFAIRGMAFPYQDHTVRWRVRRNSKTAHGFDWQEAQMSNGAWRAEIEKLPTGGPYRVQFRLLDTEQQVVSQIELHNILVGDLWFLGGQSNMDGCGKLDGREPPSMMVNAYTLANEWMNAEDPLNIASEGVYRIFRTSYGGPTVRNPIAYKSRDDHDSG